MGTRKVSEDKIKKIIQEASDDGTVTTVLPGTVHNPTFFASQLRKSTKSILARLDDLEHDINNLREGVLRAKNNLRTTIFDEFKGLERFETELIKLTEITKDSK